MIDELLEEFCNCKTDVDKGKGKGKGKDKGTSEKGKDQKGGARKRCPWGLESPFKGSSGSAGSALLPGNPRKRRFAAMQVFCKCMPCVCFEYVVFVYFLYWI